MKGMRKFNNRIEDHGILKLPLFTLSRVGDVASHSLFDRLFVSRKWVNLFYDSFSPKIACFV